MTIRRFALLYGIVFLLIGIAGFVPQLVSDMHAEHPGLSLDVGAGQLFGLFPVNIVHNAVHILFGIWGLAVSWSRSGAKVFARGVALIYLVLTIAGVVPGLMTGFGLVPLFGNDIWLHALLAAIAAYFGWLHRDPVVQAEPA